MGVYSDTTQLNSTDPVEQRTAKSVVFLFMTSRPTNWVNCCSLCRIELSWVELCRYKRALRLRPNYESRNIFGFCAKSLRPMRYFIHTMIYTSMVYGSDGSLYRKYGDISPISILLVSYRVGVLYRFFRFIDIVSVTSETQVIFFDILSYISDF